MIFYNSDDTTIIANALSMGPMKSEWMDIDFTTPHWVIALIAWPTEVMKSKQWLNVE